MATGKAGFPAPDTAAAEPTPGQSDTENQTEQRTEWPALKVSLYELLIRQLREDGF